MDEPENTAVVTVRVGLSRAPDAPVEVWQRADQLGQGERRWHRRDVARRAPLTWRELRRRGRITRLSVEPESGPATGAYPTCGACGHYTSAVVGDRCTVLVPFDDGVRYGVDYCACRCVDDPGVRQWLDR